MAAALADPAAAVSLPRWSRGEGDRLAALYDSDSRPLWVDALGRPRAVAREAVALLASAAADGLDPEDYGAGACARQAAGLEGNPPSPAPEVAAFEVALSAGVLRYLQELHEGRVDPRAIGFKMTIPADHHDFAALLRAAVAGGRLAATVEELTPPVAIYGGLRKALARYRELARDPGLGGLEPTGTTVHPGEPYARAAELRRLLVAVGDLAADSAEPLEPATYGGALVEGVRRFQRRHGLEPDGVLGKATQAALEVPLASRVRQLELALERLRWLPHLSAGRFLTVNIPAFRLLAWGPAPRPEAPSLTMAVIVGRALDRETPVFVEQMTEVIFRPYWNVPLSIARGEILPALARDPSYLRRHDMEIVAGPGDDARPVNATAANAALVRQGKLRIRQRPGPANSLGLVKFVFPNDSNVYLHGTPAPQLFARARRDFSHGCVRVEDPVALAEWALADEEGWTRERILEAMDGERSRHVELRRPIQVLLFYVTAVVSSEDGAVRFVADVYGHDARLDRALDSLARRRSSP
jgi:murein L,D-transpeptidase YcbB/YkuD